MHNKIDDGFYPELVDGACFFGHMGIPGLMNLKNAEVPNQLIPFSKAKKELEKGNTRAYIHFYEHDKVFSSIASNIEENIDLLKNFDGVITPDFSLLTGQVNCIQATNTYLNRAVGFRMQKAGIPVICNVRWSDSRSFEYCFLGAPKNDILAVSTYGTVKSHALQLEFREGLIRMIDELTPTDVVVHGSMPRLVFDGLHDKTRFHHFDDWITLKHKKDGDSIGPRI